jgi:hypothetical protein
VDWQKQEQNCSGLAKGILQWIGIIEAAVYCNIEAAKYC